MGGEGKGGKGTGRVKGREGNGGGRGASSTGNFSTPTSDFLATALGSRRAISAKYVRNLIVSHCKLFDSRFEPTQVYQYTEERTVAVETSDKLVACRATCYCDRPSAPRRAYQTTTRTTTCIQSE
jgi:hypothetical protein